MTVSQGWRRGLRVGTGLAAATLLMAVSFGAFAVANGWPAPLAILMSAMVFSGSAQFALVAAFAGGIGPALASASLMNLRLVPMGAATSRYLHGGRWRRAVEAQAVVDGSWAAARLPDGTFDRATMIAASAVQWPAWVLGTAIGTLAGSHQWLIHAAAFDLVFPAFFAVVLYDLLTTMSSMAPVAVTGAAVAAAVCLVAPTGVALLLAAGAVLLTLRPTKKPRSPNDRLAAEPTEAST